MNTVIDKDELLDKNKPDLTGKLKSFSSTDFWYYTSFDTASNIPLYQKLCANIAHNDYRLIVL